MEDRTRTSLTGRKDAGSGISPGRKMRVGFDARWYNNSGVGTYVAELLRAMAPLQEQFELVVYQHAQNKVPGLDSLPVKTREVKAGKYSIAAQFELARCCRIDSLDLFHAPFYVAPLRAPCPVVVTIHDLIPFLFRTSGWLKQSLVKAGYRAAVRHAAHLIAVSNSTARDMEKILRVAPERITTVHNGVPPEFSPESAPEELTTLKRQYGVRPPYAVAASARNWRTKNLESALRALALARQQSNIPFQTVVYGPVEGIEAAKEAVHGLDLVRAGFMPSHDLAMLFRHAHVFIMPSLYEGFGLPVLEAMACGCAVLTSDRGSLAEVAGTGAQVFDPYDVTGMAAAIAKLLTNEELLKRWRMSAVVRSRDFSWSHAAAETLSIYHRMLRQT